MREAGERAAGSLHGAGPCRGKKWRGLGRVGVAGRVGRAREWKGKCGPLRALKEWADRKEVGHGVGFELG